MQIETAPADAGIELTRKGEIYTHAHEPHRSPRTAGGGTGVPEAGDIEGGRQRPAAAAAIAERIEVLLNEAAFLIDQLDEAEALDAELEWSGDEEPAGDEGDRSWPEDCRPQVRHAFLIAPEEDEEEDDEGEDGADDEPDVDGEPSLGSDNVFPGRSMVDGCALWPAQTQVIDAGFDQRSWGTVGPDDDREEEHDGREPSLGWTAAGLNPSRDSQGRPLVEDGEDEQDDNVDSGCADSDGKQEQWAASSQACDAFERERMLTDPADRARHLLEHREWIPAAPPRRRKSTAVRPDQAFITGPDERVYRVEAVT